jgi:hypothetical protein
MPHIAVVAAAAGGAGKIVSPLPASIVVGGNGGGQQTGGGGGDLGLLATSSRCISEARACQVEATSISVVKRV